MLLDEVVEGVEDHRDLRRLMHDACDRDLKSTASLAKSVREYLQKDAVLLASLQPMTALRRVSLLVHYVKPPRLFSLTVFRFSLGHVFAGTA